MFAAIAALPPTAGKLYDPVTDLPAANRTGAALFDFNHTASQTIESGAIAQINDRFGNGFSALQNTADSRPESSANGIGGLTTAYFDGSNDFLDATASMADVSRNVGALSCLFSAKNDGGDDVRRILVFSTASTAARFSVSISTSIGGGGRILDAGDYAAFQSIALSTTNLTGGIQVNYAGAKSETSLNGVEPSEQNFLTSGNTSDTASLFVRIAASGVTSNRLQGHIADILVTPSILADLDRIDYEGWQAQRGSGLAANLPTTHRYRYQRPRTRTPNLNEWWLAAGVAPIAAYQAKGAASLEASYVNRVGGGNDLSLLTATAPALDANGWAFDGTQWLDTGIIPQSGGSMFVRFSDASGIYDHNVAGVFNGGRLYLRPRSGGNRLYGYGSAARTVSGALVSRVMGVAGPACYLDGSSDGSTGGSWASLPYSIYIGTANGVTSASFIGSIQAIVIFPVTLSAAQAAAISTAMAAL
jgi:hypothetical protein